MKAILEQLFLGKTLSRVEAKEQLLLMSEGNIPLSQMASFATVFRMRPILVEELAGFRDAMLQLVVPMKIDRDDTLDIVGTGGDGKDTFNISTTSAFVIAGAGYPVTKHGSYGVSSSCGSSDVLMKLGYEFTNDASILQRQLDAANICFFHAPLFHPAMKAVVPMRREMKVKTFFNMLGPLVNPIQPKYQLFGTYSLELAKLYQALLTADKKIFKVVFAHDGYDEISLTAEASVFDMEKEINLVPRDFGFFANLQKDLFGGADVEASAIILKNILAGQGTTAQTQAVCANAGLAIQTINSNQSLLDCVAEAKQAIENGKALNCLNTLINN